MSLPSFSVRRRVTVAMLSILVLGFGIFSLFQLKTDLYPDMDIPVIIAATSYPGSSPEDIETLVTRPIEEAAASVRGLKELSSESNFGLSIVRLKFPWGYDMDRAETDARRKLELAKPRLPEDAYEPFIWAVDPSFQPVVMFYLSGNYSQVELSEIITDKLAPMLERIDGVSGVEFFGGAEREIKVKLKPEKMEAYMVSPLQILNAIKNENSQIPAGFIEQGSRDYNLQIKGKFASVPEIGSVLLGLRPTITGEKIPLRLDEVAEIEDGVRETRETQEQDGRSAIFVVVRKQSGANTVEAADAILEALPKAVEQIGGLEAEIIFHQAEYINSSMANLQTTGLISIFVVFIVLLIFLRSLRTSLVVAFSIPISVVSAFAIMNQLGMTLNVISLAGIALAVGMLVDNSIVVTENIFRWRQKGASAFQSAASGGDQVSLAVIASTLTTVAVFVPVIFVPGIAGIMFHDLSITIIVALVVSLIVSQTILPMLIFITMKKKKYIMRSGHDTTLLTKVKATYRVLLKAVLKNRVITLIITLIALVLLGYGFFNFVPMNFMANSDNAFIQVKVNTEIGTSSLESNRILSEATKAIKKTIPVEERKIMGYTFGTNDNVQGIGALFATPANGGVFYVRLVDRSQRKRSLEEIKDALREPLNGIAGLEFHISSGGGASRMGGGEGEIQVYLYENNLDNLRKLSDSIGKKIEEEPMVGEISEQLEDLKPELSIIYDREKLAQLGLSSYTISNAIAVFFRGAVATQYSENAHEYNINVRYDFAHRVDINSLRNMPVLTPSGTSIPLYTIASVTEHLAPSQITRMNQTRYAEIAVTLKSTYTDKNGVEHKKDLRGAIKNIRKLLDEQQISNDITGWNYEIKGTAEDFVESFMFLGIAFFVSILLVFMVMASQFESLRQPFIVLFTIPLGLIGVFGIFLITGANVDITSLIGIIMLVGIVVNNGIVMIDTANQIRLKGKGRRNAIMLAAGTRIRPILMTSFTTIFSMVPLALGIGDGSEIWMGMALSIIGGLVSATFLTLFIVPIFYSFFASKRVEILE